MTHPIPKITADLVTRFQQSGFLVLPGVLSAQQCEGLRRTISDDLDPLVGPAEFEADVGYPGAPSGRESEGGNTLRRLLHAYARSEELKALAVHPALQSWLSALLGNGAPMLSQCHHNCVMTKHPGFSSATLWHQDIRYWSFDRPELISAWFALAAEDAANGALKVIPGSHRVEIDRGRLDSELFLRPELEANQPLIESAEVVSLNPGDLLLFHCRLFHAAGQNLSQQVKLSPVFTYHAEDNHPIPDTRSERLPSIALDVSE